MIFGFHPELILANPHDYVFVILAAYSFVKATSRLLSICGITIPVLFKVEHTIHTNAFSFYLRLPKKSYNIEEKDQKKYNIEENKSYNRKETERNIILRRRK